MGKELVKYRIRQATSKIFDLINEKRDKYIVLHYSCESFYDIKDGRTPRITSIAARNFSNGQTHSFSIHKSAEQKGVPYKDISANYDNLEKIMLDEFYEFIKSRHGYDFIHWNMRDISFGFQAIEHRYKVLGGDPFIIDDSRKFDLAKDLISLYGVKYAGHGDHGRLFSLMELNKITPKDILNGQQEADAFDSMEYIKLHQSTLRKVDVMSNFLERVIDGSLQTNSSWLDRNGIHPAIFVELMVKHWVWTVVGVISTIVGLYAKLHG